MVPVGRRYGCLRPRLASAGQMIGPNDLWTAAHVTVCGTSKAMNLPAY